MRINCRQQHQGFQDFLCKVILFPSFWNQHTIRTQALLLPGGCSRRGGVSRFVFSPENSIPKLFPKELSKIRICWREASLGLPLLPLPRIFCPWFRLRRRVQVQRSLFLKVTRMAWKATAIETQYRVCRSWGKLRPKSGSPRRGLPQGEPGSRGSQGERQKQRRRGRECCGSDG